MYSGKSLETTDNAAPAAGDAQPEIAASTAEKRPAEDSVAATVSNAENWCLYLAQLKHVFNLGRRAKGEKIAQEPSGVL
jgi:hypothetical protein